MSARYYLRRSDTHQVERSEKIPESIDLETVLDAGLPPLKVALEILTALGDILGELDRDGTFHGDLQPDWILLCSDGSVALSGIGLVHYNARAPESLKDNRTDRYGYGYVALRCLSSASLPEHLPSGRAEHDRVVGKAVFSIDLSCLSERSRPVVHLLIGDLMSFVPEERPESPAARRIFAEIASEIDGEDLRSWCSRDLTSEAPRRGERPTEPAPLPEWALLELERRLQAREPPPPVRRAPPRSASPQSEAVTPLVAPPRSREPAPLKLVASKRGEPEDIERISPLTPRPLAVRRERAEVASYRSALASLMTRGEPWAADELAKLRRELCIDDETHDLLLAELLAGSARAIGGGVELSVDAHPFSDFRAGAQCLLRLRAVNRTDRALCSVAVSLDIQGIPGEICASSELLGPGEEGCFQVLFRPSSSGHYLLSGELSAHPLRGESERWRIVEIPFLVGAALPQPIHIDARSQRVGIFEKIGAPLDGRLLGEPDWRPVALARLPVALTQRSSRLPSSAR